jgi:hypothetical protein
MREMDWGGSKVLAYNLVIDPLSVPNLHVQTRFLGYHFTYET